MAHVLVVDDDPIILRVIQATLIKAGHNVNVAKDGHDALDRLKKQRCDLVVTDANMPGGISGFSLVATIRGDEALKNLPVIFLTARRGEVDVKKAVQSGADDYAVKPLEPEIFLAKVEALLHGKRKGGFTSLPLNTEAVWAMPLVLKGVSEQGMTFHSTVEIVANTTFKVASKFFEEAKVAPPMLRVTHCEAAKDKASFAVRTSFVDLSAADLKLIREWIESQSPAAKKAG